jgi:hypothetical protein
MTRFLSFFNPTQWYILGGVLLALTLAFGAIGVKIHSSGVAVGEANKQVEVDKLEGQITQMKLELEQERVMVLRAHLIRVNELQTALTEAKNANQEIERKRLAAVALADRRARELRDNQATEQLAVRTVEALATAECNVVRTFAAGAYRTATTCRDAVAEIGLGVGGLVETSASAHYEHDRAEALMRFTMPTAPTGPFGDRQ